MKITVNIHDDDYEWLKKKAEEAIEKQNSAKPNLRCTTSAEKIVEHALQINSLSIIAAQLNSWIEQGERLVAVSTGGDECDNSL